MGASAGTSSSGRSPGWNKTGRHLRTFAVFYLALLCAVFTIIVYYPGYMSPDSVAQLSRARNGVADNTFPPLMDYIWAVTDKILPGPAGMLILHNGVFWFSLALIAFITIARLVWQIVFVLLAGFWPPTYGSIGTIWKDVGMQIFLLAALAAIFYAHYHRRLWPLAVSAVCMFVAAGYRHNGVAALVPMYVLVILGFAALVPERIPRLDAVVRKHNLKRGFYVAAYLVSLGITLKAVDFVYTYRVSDTKLWAHALVFDLAAISVQQNTNYLPRCADPGNQITVADLKGMYSPLHANSLIDPSCRRGLGIPNPSQKRIVACGLTEAQARDLQLRWFTVVLDNLGSYLRHRLIIAGKLFVVEARQPWYPYITGIDANPFGLKVKPSPLNSAVMRIIETSAFRTPLYSAWIYYVIVGVCLAVSFLWDFAYARAVQLLAASVCLYWLSIFFFGMSGDFRYNIWALTCAYLCPALLFAGRGRKTDASSLAREH